MAIIRNRTKLIEKLNEAKERRKSYIAREKEMLNGGVQSYTIGSRSLSRYNTDLASIRATIKELDEEIATLEAQLHGCRPRKSVGVVPRDW